MGMCMSTDEDVGVTTSTMKAIGTSNNSITDEMLKAMMPTHGLSQSLGINFSCSSLVNMDSRSKSDPFIVLWEMKPNKSKSRIGSTEVVVDSLNPEFVTEIAVDFKFEE